MKRAFGVILGQRLYYPNRQPILGLFEIENCFTRCPALLLFPLKNFFYVGVLDNRYALVKIKKPLNNVWNGIEIDVPCNIPSQGWKVRRSFLLLLAKSAAFAIA